MTLSRPFLVDFLDDLATGSGGVHIRSYM